MSRKAFGILILVAGVLAVLAFVGQRRADTESIAGESAGSLLLPELTRDTVDMQEILIEGAGEERLVSLERSGDSWTVGELGGYPAERTQINALLIALAEARIIEEKTADPAFHARLGVEDVAAADAAGLEITLVPAEGEALAVVLGDTYAGEQRYARMAESNQSVLIDRDPELPRDPSDWVDPAILSVPGSRVQRVEISHADGERVVLRKEARVDTDFLVENIPADRALQYAGVANVTGSLLEDLNLEAVERQTGEPGEPETTTAFWTFDGLVVTVDAHRAEGEDNTWLTFRARVEPEQALAFASPAPDETAGETADEGAEEPPEGPAAETNLADVTAEAEAIDRRLSGWRFRIPAYQLSQLTRRMEALLQPASTE